jgi:hypothetical protein
LKIINENDHNRLNSKKCDYVKYAFILLRYGRLSANQINFHYNKIFRSRSTALRVGMILKQYPQYFTKINPGTNCRMPYYYEFKGRIVIPPSTLIKWKSKLNP